ncbi:MAG: oxygenase, partial [Sphingomonadales bacterium]
MIAPSPAAGFPIEPVIARLSARPGIQKVPTPKLTLFMRKGFLDADFCA